MCPPCCQTPYHRTVPNTFRKIRLSRGLHPTTPSLADSKAMPTRTPCRLPLGKAVVKSRTHCHDSAVNHRGDRPAPFALVGPWQVCPRPWRRLCGQFALQLLGLALHQRRRPGQSSHALERHCTSGARLGFAPPPSAAATRPAHKAARQGCRSERGSGFLITLATPHVARTPCYPLPKPHCVRACGEAKEANAPASQRARGVIY